MRARKKVSRAFHPIARALARLGLGPSAVTLLGVLVSFAGSLLIALGYLTAGGGVLGLGASLDVIDGLIARLTSTETMRGAILDSFTDRVSEVAMWTGLAFYLADNEQSMLVMASLVAVSGSLLIPYLRSKAEGEGLKGRGGLMGRAERLLVFCWGVSIAGLGVPHLLAVTVWSMAGLTWFTVIQRLRLTWVQLDA
jgi:CDP-diacylglycerol--glycerol-3-phosphate 3-phosphatidyltransferase